MWLCPVVPMTGAAVNHLLRLTEPIFAQHGFDPLLTLSAVNERSFSVVMTIAFDREDAADREAARACYDALFEAVMAAGYPPYRVGIQSMGDLRRGVDSFWDAAASIKAALDPTGVIAPGRYDPQNAGCPPGR